MRATTRTFLFPKLEQHRVVVTLPRHRLATAPVTVSESVSTNLNLLSSAARIIAPHTHT